jgi:hypothetical protein
MIMKQLIKRGEKPINIVEIINQKGDIYYLNLMKRIAKIK